MMKKRFLALALALCMALSLVGCGGEQAQETTSGSSSTSSATATPAASVETVTLKMNSVKSSSDDMYTYWSDFCTRINDVAESSLNVEIYPSESLGTTTDMIEAISKGAAVIQDCDPSHLADYVPDMSIFMMPYLFETPEDIEKLWKSDVGQEMCAQLEAQGLHVVTMVYFGTRNLFANEPVTCRADTQGMKIRCAATPMWNEVVRVLGGESTNTAWSEVYTALSQGVADGAESPYSLLYSSKLYECVQNLSLTKHLIATTCMVMSQSVYESLSPEGQAAIDKIGSEYPTLAIEEVQGAEQEFIDLLESEGVIITEISEENLDEFRAVAATVPDNFPEWSDGLYDRVKAAIQ